jgi:choline dehydrogenase-like flavoprotein
LAAGFHAPFGELPGFDETISLNHASGSYDIIVVGNSTAGSIAAAKLRLASRGRKRILIVEAGGPTSGASHPDLNPDNIDEICQYVTGPAPIDGMYFNRLIINHFGRTAAPSDGAKRAGPQSLIVRGTTNVAVVDASLIPTIVLAHPVCTIMAAAGRAGDILADRR